MTLAERLDRIDLLVTLMLAIYETRTDAEYLEAMKRLQEVVNNLSTTP
jgi:hypothetical protein